MSDVGTSGWQGFDEAESFLVEPPWISGGHGGTVSEDNLRSVAEFIANGDVSPGAPAAPRPSMALRWASGLAPWLLFLLTLSVPIAALRWIRRAAGARRWERAVVVASVAFVAAILLDVL
jgi:hypothetical protein